MAPTYEDFVESSDDLKLLGSPSNSIKDGYMPDAQLSSFDRPEDCSTFDFFNATTADESTLLSEIAVSRKLRRLTTNETSNNGSTRLGEWSSSISAPFGSTNINHTGTWYDDDLIEEDQEAALMCLQLPPPRLSNSRTTRHTSRQAAFSNAVNLVSILDTAPTMLHVDNTRDGPLPSPILDTEGASSVLLGNSLKRGRQHRSTGHDSDSRTDAGEGSKSLVTTAEFADRSGEVFDVRRVAELQRRGSFQAAAEAVAGALNPAATSGLELSRMTMTVRASTEYRRSPVSPRLDHASPNPKEHSFYERPAELNSLTIPAQVSSDAQPPMVYHENLSESDEGENLLGVLGHGLEMETSCGSLTQTPREFETAPSSHFNSGDISVTFWGQELSSDPGQTEEYEHGIGEGKVDDFGASSMALGDSLDTRSRMSCGQAAQSSNGHCTPEFEGCYSPAVQESRAWRIHDHAAVPLRGSNSQRTRVSDARSVEDYNELSSDLSHVQRVRMQIEQAVALSLQGAEGESWGRIGEGHHRRARGRFGEPVGESFEPPLQNSIDFAQDSIPIVAAAGYHPEGSHSMFLSIVVMLSNCAVAALHHELNVALQSILVPDLAFVSPFLSRH